MYTKVRSLSIIFLVSMTTIIFLISSCKQDKDPITPPADPPETQKHIEWPSLAKSPWPMYGGGPQFTFRSEYNGPSIGEVEWTLNVPGVNKVQSITSPVIAPDSTIYFVSSYETLPDFPTPNALLYAVEPDGTIKWKRRIAKDSSDYGWFYSLTTPTVLVSGDIIVASPQFHIFSFSPEGNLNWYFESPAKAIDSRTIVASKSGDLFFVNQDGVLYCLNPNGSLKWTQYVDFGFSQSHSPSISPDGATLYLTGAPGSKSLYAFTIDGIQKWFFDNPKYLLYHPLIDNEGNIYVPTHSPKKDTVNSFIYSLNGNGEIRWKYKISSQFPSNLVMDSYGNIYFIDDNGTSFWITCLDYNGNKQWTKILSQVHTNTLFIDREGSLYIYTDHFYKYSNKGNTVTTLPISQPIWTSPIIGSDNSIIVTSVGSSNTYLTKIK
ncbi:PQQ-binding-like beta-propeller repeat protein [Zoogloea sp.]|uniref:outer membrane protein assembly factor BamB family protein n=1 Tax=Zoogloea sp. TaxID=49181 RepID=UPI001415F6A8|nr:MAG: PQQ-like beta-propeller repeat protein [Zoogloea sp.]